MPILTDTEVQDRMNQTFEQPSAPSAPPAASARPAQEPEPAQDASGAPNDAAAHIESMLPTAGGLNNLPKSVDFRNPAAQPLDSYFPDAPTQQQPDNNMSDEDMTAKIAALPTIGERAGAAWDEIKRQGNIYTSYFEENKWWASMMKYGANRQYDPFQDFEGPNDYQTINSMRGTPYQQYMPEAIKQDIRTPDELAQFEKNIETHKENMEILSNGGTSARIAALASGVIDPINLIPFTGGNIKGLVSGLTQGVGLGAAYGATYTMANQGLSAVSGVPFQQHENDLLDLAVNSLFTGILGGAAGLVAGAGKTAAEGYLKSTLVDGVPKAPDISKLEIPSVLKQGEAPTEGYGLARLGKNPEYVLNAGQIPGRLPRNLINASDADMMHAPSLEMAKSSSNVTKMIADQLFENNLVRDYQVPEEWQGKLPTNPEEAQEGVVQTKPISVEEQMKDFTDTHVKPLIKYQMDQYVNYIGRMKKEGKQAMSLADFKKQVQWARMVEDNQSDVPEVANAAKIFTEKYLSKANSMLKEVGELPEDMTIADTQYATRSNDINAIRKDPRGFIKAVKQSLMDHSGLSSSAASAKALDHYQKVIGVGATRANMYDIVQNSLYNGVKWNKERLNIPSADIFDYLHHDVFQTDAAYMEQVSRIYHMRKWLDNLSQQSGVKLKKLSDLTQLLDKEIIGAPVGEQSATMTKDLVLNKQLVANAADILTGNYLQHSNWDSALRMGRTLTYLQMMGMVTWSAMSHAGVTVMKYGFKDSMGAYGQLMKEIATGARAAHAEDLNSMGILVDRLHESYLRDLVDPESSGQFTGKVADVESILMDKYGKATGAHYFIRGEQWQAAYVAENRILRDVANFGNLSAKDRIYMSNLHIDEASAAKIAAMTEKYGDLDKGLSNMSLWNDRETAYTLARAIKKEIDTVVPRPGMGDRLYGTQRYPWMKSVMQFTNFFSGVTSKVLVPGVQMRDAAFYQGLAAMWALGTARYVIKSYIYGKEPDLSPQNLMTEGLAGSGIFGLLNGTVGGTLGVLTNTKDLAGFGDPLTNLLGPTASDISHLLLLGKGLGEQAGSVLNTGEFDPSVTDKMINQGKYLVPFRNLWQLRGLFTLINGVQQ